MARQRSREEAEEIIRASSGLGLFWATDYSAGRMAERGFDMNDARHAIRTGRLIAVEGIRYRWHGGSLSDEAETIELVMEIGRGQEVEIVSIFSVDPETRRGERAPEAEAKQDDK